MFEGQTGKELMIRQGYVPATCTLPVDYAGPLIYAEVSKGKSPCWDCHADRSVCKGQPYRGVYSRKTPNQIQEVTEAPRQIVSRLPIGTAINIAGLDLGQTTDPSALCICTRYEKNIDPFTIQPEKALPEGHTLKDLKAVDQIPKKPEAGSLTRNIDRFRAGDSEFDRDMPAIPEDPMREGLKRYYACRTLKRWQLGTNYLDIVSDIRRLDKKLDNMVLVVDNTGVGRPVVDLFRRAKLRCRVIPVTITGGFTARLKIGNDPSTGEFRVPKSELISTTQVVLQSKRIRFVEGMPETETLMNELREFRFKTTEAMNEVFSAREGEHDDIVLSLALTLWFGERAPMRFKVW